MDTSLWPGYYYDYPDDEVALQRELELIENFPGTFVDDIFPPNARSLYMDPLNPPKGSIPNDSIKWFSICEGGLIACDKPVLFNEDPGSSTILTGALGDAYFVSALSLLACNPKFIHRILVSSRHGAKGLYTFKFYKAGRWRYVHIDDHIPCRQSGKVHFCRNANPNETFAMLIEKAYAKLHGCYEALSHGVVEHALLDLTPAAGVQALRVDRLPLARKCDEVWDVLDSGIARGALIGCSRVVPEPLDENISVRQGIDLGAMYQVIDVCITSAEPTEDFDALSVGMVCVRNMKTSSGRFTGRWSFGHKLWMDYKEIAMDLRHRTREIQHKRGLGAHPDEMGQDARMDNRYMAQQQTLEQGGEEHDEEDEPDGIDGGYQERRMPFKMIQPMADDLHWIQIEDFVQIFNRVYVVRDLSLEKKCVCKRFLSKWLPGDFLVGSGGPPVVVEKHEVSAEDVEDGDDDELGERSPKPLGIPRVPRYEKVAFLSETFTDNPMFPFTVNEPARVAITMYQADKRWNTGRLGDDSKQVDFQKFISRNTRLESVMQYDLGMAFLVVRLSGLKVRVTEFKLRKVAYTSGQVIFSHANNAYLELFPGRYVIIPFTHARQDRIVDYALHFQYFTGQIEFEIDDPIAQRLQDREASDDEEDEEMPDDNDLLRVTNPATDDVSIMSFERVPVGEDGVEEGSVEQGGSVGSSENKAKDQRMVPLPRVMRMEPWEFREEVGEVALTAMYGEVGSMMKYLKTLKGEIRKLHGTIRALSVVDNRRNVGFQPGSPTGAAEFS